MNIRNQSSHTVTTTPYLPPYLSTPPPPPEKSAHSPWRRSNVVLKLKPLIALLLLLTATLAPTPASAQSSCNGVVTWTGIIPDCLSDGDAYRILFITRDTGDATSSNIADYNTFVQAQAAANTNTPFTDVTFNVLGSTDTVDARDNTNSNRNSDGAGERIFYYLGRKAADNYADFYDTNWDTAEARDQHGQTFNDGGTGTLIWTGTTNAGTKTGNSPLGGTPGNPAAFYGFRSAGNQRFSFQPQATTFRYHFYALSDVLLIGMPMVSGTYTASVNEGDALPTALSSAITDEGQDPATVAYRLAAGTTLPPGLTLNTDGSFAGTVAFTATTAATSPQPFPFQWTYTDGRSTTPPQPGTITVTDVNGAPIISGTYTASLNEGEALSRALSSVLTDEGQDPATVAYRLDAGDTLPPGLTLNTDGSFTDTVALAATNPVDSPQAFPFRWTYTDGTHTTPPQPGTITVTDTINRMPVFTPFERVIFEGANLPCLCQHVTDPPENQPDPAIGYRYIDGNLPEGIAQALNTDVGSFGQTVFPFNTATAATPAMTYTFQWAYTDANGESPQPATLIVLNNNRAPIIDALPDAAARTALVDQPFSLPLTGSDPDTAQGDPDPVWSITPATPGAAINAETGIFTWTPADTDFGMQDFIVTLSDGDRSATAPLQINVTTVNGPTATLAGTVTEATLFARQASLAPTVTVTLANTEYAAQGTLAASHFSIRDTLAGIVRVNGVTRTSNTAATLTLAYNNVDFTTNGTLDVTVAAAGHTDGRVSLTTNTIPITASVGVNICGRTPQVRDAIVEESAATECTSVTDLATIGTDILDFFNLFFQGSEIQSLQFGDFDGLTGLRRLRLRNTGLTSLPPDIFRDLHSLVLLELIRNPNLVTLPRGLFAGLTNLQTLDLRTGTGFFDDGLRVLDADIFDGLDSLDTLLLNNNNFMPGGLPEGVFDDVLDTLPNTIVVANSLRGGRRLNVDANGRAAHFACTRSDAAAIAAFAGVADCLLVSAAQFNTYLLTDATLSGLVISTGALNPAFAPGATTYTVTVPNNVDAVTVTPTANQPGATMTINGDPFPGNTLDNAIHLPTPDTAVPITIVVTATDRATTRTYTIMVTRTEMATATLAGTLTEARLFATPAPTVTVTLENAEYAAQDTLAASHFTVTDTVTGIVSVSGITRDSATTATLTLAYTTEDITTDGTLAVTVAAAGHTVPAGTALATNTIRITASAGVNICGRTPAVRDAIVRASTGAECTNINDLSTITGSGGTPGVLLLPNVTTLQRGDFAGLSAITNLQLPNNRLTSLPDNVFAGLSGLTVLNLLGSNIDTLSPNAFAGLTGLTGLSVRNNNLNTLPAGLFAGLPVLITLDVRGNPFTPDTGLPVGIFDDILDTLGPITTGSTNGLRIDDAVRAAHFVCPRPDAARIEAANGGADCLRITAALLNTFVQNDAALSALAVSTDALVPEFDPGITTYTVDVANSVERVTVTPAAAQAGAVITINDAAVTSGSPGMAIPLTPGTPAVITIEVTSANGSVMETYTVTVTRPASTAPTARLTGPTLTGATLNTATVTVRLDHTEYVGAAALGTDDFRLTTDNLAGTVSAGGVTRTSNSVATLTLAHSGENIATTGALFVTVLESAHTGAGNLPAGSVPVLLIRGDTTGTVTEDAMTNIATGRLAGAFTPVTHTGIYGRFTLEANGAWTYRLDNADPDTDALEHDARGEETFEVQTTGGLMETVTITVIGIGDITGDLTGSVIENVDDSTGGSMQVTCSRFTTTCFANQFQEPLFGTYGIFAIGDRSGTTGFWFYILRDDNSPFSVDPLPIVEALAEGQIVTDTFDITADNGAPATIVITITGTNDLPIVEAGDPQTVAEDDPVTLTGAATDLEEDSAALTYQWTQTGGMHTVTLASANTATATFTATNVFQDTVLIFTLTVTDSANAAVTDTVAITVDAINNPPTVEAGPPQTVNEGDEVTLDGAATDSEDDADPNDSAALAYQWTQTGGMPTVTLAGDTTATATFTMPDLNANTVLTFTLTVTDSANVVVTDTVTITGNNDPPTAEAGPPQTVIEGDPVTLDGAGSTDPGNSAALAYQWTQTGGTPTVTLTGADTATATFTAPDLPGNTVLTFTLTVTNPANTADTDTVTITIQAENAPATFGGDRFGQLFENAESNTFVGTLTATDPDHDDNTFEAIAPITNAFGTFSLTRNGIWTYILDNSNIDTQGLSQGISNIERFPVLSIDGTETDIAIQIFGANDPPTAEAGPSQTVTEDDIVTLTGSAVDPDAPPPPQAALTFVWEYTNNMDIVTRLGEGPILIFPTTDVANFDRDTVVTFTVTATDGHGAVGADTVDITILSDNDPTTLGGDLTGDVTDNGGRSTITGRVTAMDPDGEDNVFMEVPLRVDDFGTFNLTRNGDWTYTLDNNHPATKAIPAGGSGTVRQNSAVQSGGTVADVVITINGANDPPIAEAGDPQTVPDDMTVTLDGRGSSDPDRDDELTYQWGQIASSDIGSFFSPGATVTLINADTPTPTFTPPFVIDFEQLDDPFTVTFRLIVTDRMGDESMNTVVITLTRSITGDTSATINYPNSGGETAIASGRVSARGAAFVSETIHHAISGGTFEINAAGMWTFTLDHNDIFNNAFGDLAGSIFFGFRVNANNGASQGEINFTITGDDPTQVPAVITGDLTGAINEDADPNTVMGTLTLSNPNDGFLPQPSALRGSYGRLSQRSSTPGTNIWTYTQITSLSGLREINALAVGDSLTDTFTLITAFGATADVVITINGVNDPPTANAGEGKTVNEREEVTLSGSGSDPDTSDVLTYAWEQTGGRPRVMLVNADTPTATFFVPDVAPPSPRFTFTLTVTDSAGATATDEVRIIVGSVDDPTIISGRFNAFLTEDGVNRDDRNRIIGTLTVSDPDSIATPLAAQPNTPGIYGDFSLTVGMESVWTYTLNNNDPDTNALAMGEVVTDEFLVQTNSTRDPTRTVTITVFGANDAPTANAGPDQPAPGDIINAGLLVTLDGSESMDPDTRDRIAAYAWTQTGDTALSHPVILNTARLARPTFTAPDVTAATALTFSLVVQDTNVAFSDPDSVIITVNSLPALSINSPSVREGDSGTVELTYTVTLIGATPQTVMVDYADANSGTATLGTDYIAVPPGQMMFAPGVGARTITVTVRGDTVDEPDETVVIALSNQANAALTAVGRGTIINDDDDPVVTLALAPASISERGGTAMVTAMIDRESATSTTITVSAAPVSPAVAGDYTMSGTMLTITAGDTTSAGAVTITAVDNNVDDVADKQVTVSATAANPNGVTNPATQTLTITDDDMAGVTVMETDGGTTVAEPDGTDTYTVVLRTEPTADVTITPASNDPMTATVSAALTFTPANWNMAQTVTVVGVNDDIANPAPRTATMSHTIDGGGYDEVAVDNVDVTVTDDDMVGFTFLPTTVSVNEGGTSPYTVALATQPTGPVTVALTASGDLTVTPTSLTFTPTDWNTAQTVTVTAGEDDDGNNDTVTVTHDATGGEYDALTGMVPVTIVDNDVPGVFISPTALAVPEGGQNTYTVRLDTQPTGDVTVTVGGASGDVSVIGSPVTFTTVNWNTDQTVTVTAGQDADAVPDALVTLTHGVTGYGTVRQAADVVVTVTEDDAPGFTFPPDAVEVDEGGSSTYTVALATQPTVPVTVALTAGGDLTVAPMSLNFTTNNWNTAQTVTVTAGEDDDGNNDTVTVTHTATGAEYEAVTGTVVVTIVDNDVPGVFISPTALEVPEGGENTYTVRLDTQPTGTVAVTVGGLSGDVGVTGSPLTFTTGNWDQMQPVTVTAAQDADATPDSPVTLTHGVTGYDTVTSGADVVVTITEDDMVDLVLPDAVSVNEGDTSPYTVALATQPTGSVTVALTVDGELTVAPASLNFTTNNWNTAQTVTVTAGEDDDGNNDTVTVTHTATGADYEAVTGTVPVTVVDNDVPGVRVSTAALAVPEGGQNTYTVRLNTQPTGDVTVTVGGASGDVSVTGSPVTFTTVNWNTDQTVTVTAGQDDDAVPDALVTLTHGVTGYGTVTSGADVVVTVTEDDTPGFTFPPDAVQVDEGGSSTYTVALATQPTVPVTVALTAGGDLTVAPMSLNFTTNNWNTAQTVTVTAGEDDDGNNDTVTVTHTASGAEYEAVTGTVVVTIVDNDVPGVFISPTALEVPEGGENTYTVRLDTQPTGPVAVTVGGLSGEVGVTGSPLTFTTGNWDQMQPVTVTAAQDADATPDSSVTLTHGVTGYGDVTDGADVVVTIIEDDMVDLVLPDAVSVNEGDTSTYTVALATQPTGSVTVALTVDGELTVAPASLNFTTNNWNTAQTVTVTAGEDDDGNNDTVTVTHTATGAEYEAVTGTVVVTIVDNDVPGVFISPTALDVPEGGENTYTVRLDTQPTGPVAVTVGGLSGEVGVTGSPVTFTIDNWNTDQTVTVTAGQDADAVPDALVTLTHGVTGYGTVRQAADVVVTVTEDDAPGFIFPPDAVQVDEGGSSAYTVALATQPTVPVTVALTAGGDLTVAPMSLNFTTNNWNTAQTVTVTAGEDDDGNNDTVTVTHTATGAEYEAVTGTVVVTIVDNDVPGVFISPTALEVPEGGENTYTVRLDTQPTGTVAVTVGGESGDVGVTGSPLTFTTGNWDQMQPVTVTAAQDADATPDSPVTLTHGVTGYDTVTSGADVVVTITEDDMVDLVLPDAVSVNEGDTSPYTVALATQPTGSVTVALTVDGELTVAPASLNFTTNNWNTAQTVTVTAGEDDDGNNDTVTVTHTATGAEYEAVTGTVPVTVVDNDVPGVFISPTALDVPEGGENTYTVRLDTQPTDTVTVTVGGASGDVSVTGSPVTFTIDNWNTDQTVTVTAGQDADAVPDALVTLTHGVTGYGTVRQAADVVVTVTEDDAPGFTFPPDAVEVDEGGSSTYTVALATQPTVPVTVALTTGGDLTVAPMSLNFTTNNWNTAQTVTVTAGEDDDGNNDTVTVTHTATGAEYEAVTGTVVVTIVDNDVPGVFISPTALAVPEGGENTYTVRLDTQPTGTVAVTVGGLSGEVGVIGSPLTFTMDTWNTAQTVTVTAAQDDDAALDTVTLTHGVTGYGDVISGAEVVVTVTEDDTVGLTFNPGTLRIEEGGSSAYTVALATQPTGAVTVALTVGGDLVLDTTALTFTITDWNTAQTVTITAGEDADGNNDTVTVTHAVAGADYEAVTGTVPVTVVDNDVPGVRISPTALAVPEGGQNTYTVRLDTQPTDTVAVTVGGESGEVGVTGSPVTLTFTMATWNTEQTVTVTAGQDDDAVPDTVTLTHGVTGYGTVTRGADVVVTVTEDDVAGFIFIPDAVRVNEEDTSSYMVALTAEPTVPVTVAITAGGDLGLDTTALAFDATDWNIPQMITINAGDDDDGDDDHVTLVHTATGGEYEAVTGTVPVTVMDNDTPGVRISTGGPSTDSLMVPEGGQNTYAMRLNTPPTGDVEVTVGGESGEVRVTGSPVTFTTVNWNVEQRVTVHAGQDDDAVPDTVTLTHGVTGYGTVRQAANVVVTVTEDDTAGVTVSRETLAVRENGGTVTYTLVLDTQPIAPAVLTVVSDDTAVATVSPARLTFTPINWRTAQTVTVTGGDDTIDNPTALTTTLRHTITGGDYNMVTIASVTVTTTNDLRRAEAVGITLAVIGRTLATSTVEAISTRFAPEAVTAQATLGGLPCNLPRRQDNADEPGTPRRPPAPQGTECKLSWKSFLARGASFSYALPDTGPGTWMVWGRGDVTNFQGQPRETVSLDGELVSSYVGMDYRQGNRGLIGLALSRSTGEVGYQIEDKAGMLDVELASVYPYIHWSPIKGLGLWGLVGAGRGNATIMHDGLPTLKTDLGMRMAALGVRRELFDDVGGRLALKADALWVEMEAEAAGGTLPVVTGEASRARLALENKIAVHESPNVRMSVRLELGLRVDGGDAEQGLGMEAGGGLEYVLRQPGLTVEASGRTLLAHQAAGWQEWGASVTMRLDPALDGQGLAIALTPVWGQAASGVDALWSRQGAIQTATDAPRPGQPRTAWQPDQMDVELGYGITLPTRRLLTPFGKLGLAANQGRRLQMGMRLGRTGTPQLELIGEQTRAQNNQTPEYRIGMTWSLPF